MTDQVGGNVERGQRARRHRHIWPGLKGVHATCVSRVLRLDLLATEVEAILDGRQPVELQLDDLLVGFPSDWEGHRRLGSSVSEPQH